jgi:glycerol kinase
VLNVDGGAAMNDTLLQLQADVLGVPVRRPRIAETTALGAAYLAGLAVGYWSQLQELAGHWALDRQFQPSMEPTQRDALCQRWSRAVQRAQGWEQQTA